MLYRRFVSRLVIVFVFAMISAGAYGSANAAQLTLTWVDNSDNESGFSIDRRIGATGTYQPLTTVASNVTSHTDLNLASNTTYCYRVGAFNSAGTSNYSNETCATTPAASFTVSVSRAGTGTGTVTSSPSGINCGTSCSTTVVGGTAVTLSAIAAGGSIFSGWSGNGACSGGSFTVTSNIGCTATFNLAPLTYTLTLARAGTGSGTITSSPTGINCGSTCSATFNSGAAVTLTATAASGSVFAGWSGNGCSSGSVTLVANTTCTATFNLQTFSLTVARAGTGSGAVTSSPAGINCGSICSATFSSGAAVTLTATAASGSVFAGWSGTGCSSGSITVNSNVNCTATFNLVASYALKTSVVNQITSTGSASGRIVSNPAGIDCGTDCTESYSSGTTVTLTAIPASNSKFSGWTGDSDCSDASVTMNANRNCTANFSINTLTLSVAKNGNGTVTSAPSGINCGTSCSYSFAAGTTVTLQAAPSVGYTFSGWSGACTGTSNCVITLSAATAVTANFFNSLTDKVGLYRPSTGEWFLDRNGNGAWDGCDVDVCEQPFGGLDGIPVVGDWNGSGSAKLGLFVTASAQWLLDVNGNGAWDGCASDACRSFGKSSDIPVVGQWTSGSYDRIAIFRPSEEKWHLDLNGNGILDRCTTDKCPSWSIYQRGDVPVVGDWSGRGTAQLGLYRPSTGQWFLDRNANRTWDGCRKDLCLSSFGTQGDMPVTGDWNGTGASKIGVFRPSTGEWFLDLNGNGKWDGPSLDLYVPAYGQPGDLPVVGRW